MPRGRELKVYLTSDVSKFTRSLGKAEHGVKGFAKRAGIALGAVAAAAGALAIKIGKDAVEAAAQEQAAMSNLATTMKQTVGATEGQIAAMEEYIDLARQRSGIDDNDLRKGMGRLLRSTKNATRAQALMNTAMEISVATGKPLGTVVEALAKFNDGNAGALKRLGITQGEATRNYGEMAAAIKDLHKKEADAAEARKTYGPKSKEYAAAQAKVAKALEKIHAIKGQGGTKWLAELNSQFDGSLAADAKTYAGTLRRVESAVGELNDSLGKGIIEGFLESVGGVDGDNAIENLEQMQDDAQNVGEAIGGLAAASLGAASDFVTGVKGLSKGWSDFVDELTIGVINLLDSLAILGDEDAARQRDYLREQMRKRQIAFNFDMAGPGDINKPGGGSFPGKSMWGPDGPRSPNAVDHYNQTRHNTRAADATGRGSARGAQRDAHTRGRP